MRQNMTVNPNDLMNLMTHHNSIEVIEYRLFYCKLTLTKRICMSAIQESPQVVQYYTMHYNTATNFGINWALTQQSGFRD